MSRTTDDGRPRIAIIGGGLAGLAAAVALSDAQCQVELYEARRFLGGRAGSFRDANTGETVDHCQHVSMGCCTNLADFCRRVGSEPLFRQDSRLYFVGPDGRALPFQADPLPAPLHLARSFWGLKYLSVGERLGIARAMWRLMRLTPADLLHDATIGTWLKQQRQTPQAIEYYWNVILVSALGEDLDRASLSAARKVIVDGFLASRKAYVLQVPRVPLAHLYGDRLEQWLQEHGVEVHLNTPLQRLECDGRIQLDFDKNRSSAPDKVILAMPWFRLPEVLAPGVAELWPDLQEMSGVDASPITGVHLWFDRAIMPHDHVVLVGRLSQWVFRRSEERPSADPRVSGHYYQVVVSASRNLSGRDRDEIVQEVCGELAAIWPAAAAAQLLHARLVTDRAAVFSVRPGLDKIRPPARTNTPGVFLAGDWTATGWPATMEGAVRSGYRAAEDVLADLGVSRKLVCDDLPRGWLARLLIR